MMSFDTQAYLESANIWVLSDGKPGHENQSLGVCEALGVDPQVIWLEKRPFGKLLQWLYPSLYFKNLPSAPWPDMIISAGYHTSVAAKWVKMKNPETILVHMMKPKGYAGAFTVLAIPEHDRPKLAGNVITTMGAPHRVSAEKLQTEKEKWQGTLNPDGKKTVAVIVGGNSKSFTFNKMSVKALLSELEERFGDNVRYMVTMSRRTGDGEKQTLKGFFEACDSYFYDGQGENPYFGMLACADAVVVTAESVSMISEAVATSAPVYAFDLKQAMKASKLKRFYTGFLKAGRVLDLSETHKDCTLTPYLEAKSVAAFIKSKLIQRHI
ncbi:MAG: mitochondrial fission ELM1 family protein [Alphaproteobacteria bacterium]|nr:mitochondrial fission ELM1 family protein [Alphaproteobacteria bacterium]